MFTLPSPLHPAVVHFPIALILVGAAFALVSVFVKERSLRWVSALLLALGAIGAFVAVQTGESAQEIVGKLAGVPDRLLDEHEDWAERTELAAAIAAALAITAAILGRVMARRDRRRSDTAVAASEAPVNAASAPLIIRAATALTAAVAVLTCFFVYQTGRRGGELVYDYGIGTRPALTGSQSAPASHTGER